MKFLVVLLALLAITQAEINLNAKDSRIVGGEIVIPHSIPYQVALLLQKNGEIGFCGGSLISTSFVLTAAHCIQNAIGATVILGAHKYQEVEDSQVRVGAKRFIIHPDYEAGDQASDIGLIELNETVTLNDNIQLSRLPTQADVNKTYEHTIGTVSGWGSYSDGNPANSEELRSVSAQIMTNAECVIAAHKNIAFTQVCTNGDRNVGVCYGDSGGPLVVANQQIGVASTIPATNCELGLPSIYIRVTSFLDFIASEVY